MSASRNPRVPSAARCAGGAWVPTEGRADASEAQATRSAEPARRHALDTGPSDPRRITPSPAEREGGRCRAGEVSEGRTLRRPADPGNVEPDRMRSAPDELGTPM